jgi:hypothetical protein
MNRLYAVLPWPVIALGLVHMGATWRFYDHVTPTALWFFNGGIVLLFAGVLNLVNRRYGADAIGLLWFCRLSNVVTLCFATIAGFVGGGGTASLVIVLGIMGGLTLLSFLRPALSKSAV